MVLLQEQSITRGVLISLKVKAESGLKQILFDKTNNNKYKNTLK